METAGVERDSAVPAPRAPHAIQESVHLLKYTVMAGLLMVCSQNSPPRRELFVPPILPLVALCPRAYVSSNNHLGKVLRKMQPATAMDISDWATHPGIICGWIRLEIGNWSARRRARFLPG